LQSAEENQAWDVLNACLGQLRFIPSGQVAGIDMSAALKIAEVRGFETGVMSELLSAAENGLIEAMNQKETD
jgi:hypothetical protein